jgi:CRP-like cAMP-binding protein
MALSAAGGELRADTRPQEPDGASLHPCGDEPVTLNDHLAALRPFATLLHFLRNETIFCEGETADQVYQIIIGTVRLCRHTSDGRRNIIEFLLPGDLIGFLECPDQPATAEAVTDVMLMSYPRSGFDRLAASNPAIRLRVLCYLSASLLEVQQHLFVLGCQNAKERVASFLVRLAERMDIGASNRLDLAMGRQDIADHLGLTVETVSRTISALRADGIVAVPNSHQMTLLDMRALRGLAIEG